MIKKARLEHIDVNFLFIVKYRVKVLWRSVEIKYHYLLDIEAGDPGGLQGTINVKQKMLSFFIPCTFASTVQ